MITETQYKTVLKVVSDYKKQQKLKCSDTFPINPITSDDKQSF